MTVLRLNIWLQQWIAAAASTDLANSFAVWKDAVAIGFEERRLYLRKDNSILS